MVAVRDFVCNWFVVCVYSWSLCLLHNVPTQIKINLWVKWEIIMCIGFVFITSLKQEKDSEVWSLNY